MQGIRETRRPVARSSFLSEETARRCVAGLLHRTFSQSLFGMGILLDLWTKRVESGESLGLSDLETLGRMLDEAQGDLRRLMQSLNPLDLDPANFASALRGLAAEAGSGHRCKVHCSRSNSLKAKQALALYRIAEKTVETLKETPGTAQVHIRMGKRSDRPCLTIHCRGLPLPTAYFTAIRKYVRAVSGTLQVEKSGTKEVKFHVLLASRARMGNSE